MLTSEHRGRRIAAVLAVVVSVWAVGVVAFDEDEEGKEREISLKEAPKAIRAALDDVEVEEIDVVTSDGQKIFEVVIEVDDNEVELQLTADAKLVGVEIEHEAEDSDDSAKIKDKEQESRDKKDKDGKDDDD